MQRSPTVSLFRPSKNRLSAWIACSDIRTPDLLHELLVSEFTSSRTLPLVLRSTTVIGKYIGLPKTNTCLVIVEATRVDDGPTHTHTHKYTTAQCLMMMSSSRQGSRLTRPRRCTRRRERKSSESSVTKQRIEVGTSIIIIIIIITTTKRNSFSWTFWCPLWAR